MGVEGFQLTHRNHAAGFLTAIPDARILTTDTQYPTREDAMSDDKKKTPNTRENYYRRSGQTVINVGLTAEDRAEIEAAIAKQTGAGKLAPFLRDAAMKEARRINARKS